MFYPQLKFITLIVILFESVNLGVNSLDLSRNKTEKLEQILNRVGPNMRASANYFDFEDIQLNESIEAWKLMGEEISSIAKNQLESYSNNVQKILSKSGVGHNCLRDSLLLLKSALNFDIRPIQSE